VISNDGARSQTPRSGGGRERAARLRPPAPATKGRARYHRFCAAGLAPPERPQRILQTLGQRNKALTAEHDMGMLEAREGEPEVV
jgi:hypothetical protein